MRRKTVLGDLILITGGIAFGMVMFASTLSYFWVSVNLRKSLEEASIKTARAIARALEMPLNLASEEMALGVAGAYLAAGETSGLRIESNELGIVIDSPPGSPNILPPVEAGIAYKGRSLGRLTLWFDDTALRNARRGLLMTSIIMLASMMAAYGASIAIIVRRVVAKPFKNFMAGIEAVGAGNYGSRIPPAPHSDLNVLVDAFNRMSENVKASEASLQESERRYGVIFDASFAAIILIDEHGRIRDVNRSMISIFGLANKGEALRYDLRRDYSPPGSDASFLETAWAEAIAGKDMVFGWTARRPRDGSNFSVEVFLRRIELSAGTMVLASILDLTERRKMEEQLVRAQKMEAIGTIAGGLAHDFNNILGGITGTASVLQFIMDSGDEVERDILAKALDTIQDASFRAANVVGKLLTLSKGRNFEVGVVDMKDVVNRMIAIAENAMDKSVAVSLDFPQTPVRVMGDRTQLEQVALNLIVNAAHAMTLMRPRGERWGGKLKVVLAETDLGEDLARLHPDSPKGGYAVLSVSDTGIGIRPEDMEKIFLPFYTTKEKGSGLGLSMAYSIAKAHDGFLDVESARGKGSEIRVFIPKTEEAPPEATRDGKGGDQWRGEGKVLVIDDEEALRESLKAMLEQCGYEVAAAADGEEGLRAFEAGHEGISLVFLDMSMPRLSGREAYFGMKAIDPEVRIILMSGYRQDERVAEVLADGVACFLQKPFDRARLIAAIRAATGA